MIAFVKASTGREPDLVVGKPNRLIVDAAAARLGLPVEAMGMIGDRLYTDIALGQSSGILTVLVLSGETHLEDLQGSPFQPDYTFAHLGEVADWLEQHARLRRFHMNPPQVIIIGAGSTGSALAHDLALRGLSVTVVERAGVASGTTGHNQAQLHSGARYAVVDPELARECIQENRILRQIMPGVLELNEGLFVAISEQDLAYSRLFLEACQDCGIPTVKHLLSRRCAGSPCSTLARWLLSRSQTAFLIHTAFA